MFRFSASLVFLSILAAGGRAGVSSGRGACGVSKLCVALLQFHAGAYSFRLRTHFDCAVDLMVLVLILRDCESNTWSVVIFS